MGGDPTAVAIAGPWADLGDYETFRAALMAENGYRAFFPRSAGLFAESSLESAIWQIL